MAASASTRNSNKIHDTVGLPSELSQNVLPTNSDVIRAFYHTRQSLKTTVNKHFFPSLNETNAKLVPAIINLWVKASLPHTTYDRVVQMITEQINKLKSIQSQPNARLQSPAYLKRLEEFKQDLTGLFDITSCKCAFDLSAPVQHGKIICPHPFDKRIPERELSFILDQRRQRRMVIGSIDAATTKHNVMCARKRPRDEVSEAVPSTPHESRPYPVWDSDSSISTVDYSTDSSEMLDTTNTEEEYQRSSLRPDIISNKACVLSTKKLSSYRLSQGLLDCGAEQLNVPDAKRHHTTFYRRSTKLTKTLLEDKEAELHNAVFHQLCYDGKKIFQRERLAVLSHFCEGNFFVALQTFRKGTSITGENCFNALKQLIHSDLFKNVISIMTDTTAVNTGRVKGICARMTQYINEKYGHDVHVLECLYHTIELYLDDIITAYDGDTKSPDKLVKDSVFNLISKMKNDDLTESNLQQPNIKPSALAQKVIGDCLEGLLFEFSGNNHKSMRDDQACLLALVCFTFMDVPQILLKFLFRKQETIHHARWLTKASGYLRILNFNPFVLTNSQTTALESICQFVLDVYAPMFISIYVRPSAVEGPALVLLNRDLMISSQPAIVKHTKSCFLKHAMTWLSPKNVALSCHSSKPPVKAAEVSKISTTAVDIRHLLWSNRPLAAFFDVTSQCSPCISLGQPKDWISFKNNQMANERLIGNVTRCLSNRKVKDSDDGMTDDQIKKNDNKIRAYVNAMTSDLEKL